jgi:hypothetical protein
VAEDGREVKTRFSELHLFHGLFLKRPGKGSRKVAKFAKRCKIGGAVLPSLHFSKTLRSLRLCEKQGLL